MSKNLWAGLIMSVGFGSAAFAQTENKSTPENEWTKVPIKACESNVNAGEQVQSSDSVFIPTKFAQRFKGKYKVERDFCKSFRQFLAPADDDTLKKTDPQKRYTIVIKNEEKPHEEPISHIGLLMVDADSSGYLSVDENDAGETAAVVEYRKKSACDFAGDVWIAGQENALSEKNPIGRDYNVKAKFTENTLHRQLVSKEISAEKSLPFPGYILY